MRPETSNIAKLAGAKHIAPLRQGELDSLCGMYAAINAIRLTHAVGKRLKRHDEEALFKVGAHFLKTKNYLQKAIVEGMTGRVQIRLARHLINYANERLNSGIQLHQLQVKKSTLSGIIEGEIESGRPVCALFNGALDHYSVIMGYSKTRFYLFDSMGLAWTRRDLCQLGGSTSTARHVIDKRSLFSIGFELPTEDAGKEGLA